MRYWWTFFLLTATCLKAQDVGRMYTQSQLEQAGSRYEPNLRGLWEEDFLSRLTPAERSRAGSVMLVIPLIGVHKDPLDYYSHAGRRQVFIPVASVKFWDDIATAIAFYESNRCDITPVVDYAASLRLRPEELTGAPLERLGVPAPPLPDPVAEDVAQKMLKSVIYFIVAHEYGHVMYQHPGYKGITAQQAQMNESEADAFALSVFRRTAVPPIALGHFFLITSVMEPSPADFGTPEEYEAYLQQAATHPVSAARLTRLAEGLQSNTAAYTRLQRNPAAMETALRGIADQLQDIARTLDDRKMRRFVIERARNASLASFLNGCSRSE